MKKARTLLLGLAGAFLLATFGFWQGSKSGPAIQAPDNPPRVAKESSRKTPSAPSHLAGAKELADFTSQANALNARIMEAGGNAEAFEPALRALLADWARVNPEAALHYALRPYREDEISRGFFEAADAALEVWMEIDAVAARNFVEREAVYPRAAAEFGPAIARFHGETDPEGTLHWLRSGFTDDRSSELRSVVAFELVGILAAQGRTKELEAWLRDPSVANSAYAQEATRSYGRFLAEKDPQQALAFSVVLPPGTTVRSLVLQEALHAWALKNPSGALAWLGRTVPSEKAWPDSAGDAVNARPVPKESYSSAEMDYARAGYLLALARTSPENARQRLKDIRNLSLRERLARQLEGF